MNSTINWAEESNQTLSAIENKKDYVLILGVCFVYSAYTFLKSVLEEEVYSVRIQNGQLHHDYPFDKLHPSSILMCVAWGSMAACLENPKHDGYLQNYYLPILEKINRINVPTLILDFPASLDRYCYVGAPQYKDLPDASKGYIKRAEARSRGWSPQNPQLQYARRMNFKRNCIAPFVGTKITYVDVHELLSRSFSFHNRETSMDLVSIAPWHWTDYAIEKIVSSFLYFKKDILTKEYFINL